MTGILSLVPETAGCRSETGELRPGKISALDELGRFLGFLNLNEASAALAAGHVEIANRRTVRRLPGSNWEPRAKQLADLVRVPRLPREASITQQSGLRWRQQPAAARTGMRGSIKSQFSTGGDG